jgi:hypothetical protein
MVDVPESRRLARRIVRLDATANGTDVPNNPADLLGGSFGFLLSLGEFPELANAGRIASGFWIWGIPDLERGIFMVSVPSCLRVKSPNPNRR